MSEQPNPDRGRERVEALRRRRGDEHPETLAAMLDLAEMLWCAAGSPRCARSKSMSSRCAVVLYGEAYGDTLKALGKLATTIGAEGDLAEARRLQEHILALALRSGARMRATRCAPVNNLAGTVAAQGDFPARVPSWRAQSRSCTANSATPTATPPRQSATSPRSCGSLASGARLIAAGTAGRKPSAGCAARTTRQTRAALAVLAAMQHDGMP